ncbi:unnamed protein product [Somion occarium]|uniref:C3H1-type domain-containing protein n=1 Tax=Somion occarium TaxID=3059160 RepID=A0ABP1D0P0_9APHY
MLKDPRMVDNNSASEYLLDKCLKTIQNEVKNLTLNLNEEQTRRIQELEAELQKAKSVIDFFQGKLESVKDSHAKEKEELNEELAREKEQCTKEMQLIQGLDRRVICLIDGDGAIFSLVQVAKGQAGGQTAAAKLTESIRQYLPSDHYQLSVWVFLNKGGLLETLRKCGKEDARRNLEDFIKGFNQAADRFLMVDVGSGKEAVDAKIKDEAKALQTIKVVFGGCHDNGYLTTLRSLITAGYAAKVVLLQGYIEMAAGFRTLELPCLKVPDLFEPEKLCPSANVSPVISAATPAVPPGLNRETVRSNSATFVSIPSSSAPISLRTPLLPIQTTSQGVVWRNVTSPSPPHRSRHIDPNKSLSKQEPPPCNVFYLTGGCKFGASCTFAHDYLLTAEHIETMRDNAKKSPCATLNRGEACVFGDTCCYGHKCQFGSKCHFYKMGMCKFIAVGMHAD